MLREVTHVTIKEFDRFIMLPENVDRSFEYIGGKIVEVVANNYSSKLGMFIGSMMTVLVWQRGLGHVTGADGGYIVMGEKYIPDVAFISRSRQPEPCHDTYNPNSPDLAVEVLSPTNDTGDMRIKIVNYLRAGTTVWVVDPDRQQIEVYAPGQAPVMLGINDTLDGGNILPGFKLALKDIFAS
jgi:Uma2 family endonuclease